MTKNLVSIIVPIYNTEKYLTPCLESILAQTYENLEIILVDDGSTDNSKKIADDFAKKDSRVKVFSQSNSGQSSARNLGIKKSTGEFISFIDSDDKIDKRFIEKLIAPFLENEKTCLTVCGIHYKRLKNKTAEDVYISKVKPQKTRETKKSYILRLLATDGRLYSSVNKLYKTEFVKKLNFDEKLNFAEDTKFVLDYLKLVNSTAIKFVLEPLYIYNFGTETSTIKSSACDWGNWVISYKNLKTWVGKNPKRQEKFWLRLIYLRWRISHVRSKRRAK